MVDKVIRQLSGSVLKRRADGATLLSDHLMEGETIVSTSQVGVPAAVSSIGHSSHLGSGTVSDNIGYPLPTIASTGTPVNPATGDHAGNTTVVITGTGFLNATGVTFGGSAATGVVVDSDTQITCHTPAHAAGAVNVVVTTPGGTATKTNGFTYT